LIITKIKFYKINFIKLIKFMFILLDFDYFIDDSYFSIHNQFKHTKNHHQNFKEIFYLYDSNANYHDVILYFIG